MTMLVPTNSNVVTDIVSGFRRTVKDRTGGLREMPYVPTLFVVKTAGGVGADFLVSMIDSWLTDAMDRPFVIQVGGAAGHVVRTHPAELFQRLHIDMPDIDAKLIDLVCGSLGTRPVVAMVEASFIHKLPDIFEAVSNAGVIFPIVTIVLVGNSDVSPKILPILSQYGPVALAMLTPVFDDEHPEDLFLIPRLPPAEATLMRSTQIDFRTLLARMTIGNAVTFVRRLGALHQLLEKIYVQR